jgi:ligand-binding sensor domain-containing protein
LNEQFILREVKIEDGLSQSTVYCMLQDRKGYLWFGTANGLNRYDGYSFLVFVNDPADTTSISGNGILSICEDSDGFIWVGTTDGVLNRFDRKLGIFTHYNITDHLKVEYDPDEMYYDFPLPLSRNNEKSISAIAQDSKGFLWIGTWGRGLIKFDPRKNTSQHFHYEEKNPNGFHSNRVKAILPERDGAIWIATLGGGLYKLIPEKENTKILKYEHNKNPYGLYDNKLFSLFKDSNDDLWIGTYGNGILKLSKHNQQVAPLSAKFENVIDNSPQAQSISHEIVTSFIEDKDGIIWIGSFGGVVRYDLKKKSYFGFGRDTEIEKSISKNDVFSILQDKSGTIWIGTHLGKGLSNLERSTLKFKQIKKSTTGKDELNDDVVWAIYEDQISNLWIGTYRGGLNLFNKKTGKYSYYKNNKDDSSSISDNHIRAIIDDNAGNLWIGTYSGGLNIFNKKTKLFKRIANNPSDSTTLGANQVQAILIDRYNNFWIGTFGGGLNKLSAEDFNSGKIKFKKYMRDKNNPFSISDDRIYALFESKDGIIWIGTFGGGLNKFDPKKEQFISYANIPGDESSLSDNRVMSIYEDPKGFLWIGTYGGGLQKFDKRTEKFVRFSKRNRMNSSVVYAILADKKNNLWMSTDNGLFKLNTGTETFTQYDLHDGLQSLEFSGGAYFKSKTGEMFFGGINGLNHFFPDSVKDNTSIPPIVISQVRIFNEPIRGEKENIELSYWQNFFSFEFSSLDYTSPQDNQYAYKLEGFDNGWRYVDSRRRVANYTNLSPGEYIFHVRGSNNDGLWNDEGAKIYLTILPPFWKTWWFLSLSGFFITLMIFYLSTIRYKNLLSIEKLKSRLAADLHDNIGSGLTEISILSELASNEIKEPAKNLNLISEKARVLIDTMSDIVWMVNPKRDTFYHFILRLKDSYVDVLNSAGISFKTINLEKFDKLRLPMEYKQNLFLIFKEAINNAVKHSKCKKIVLEAGVTKEMMQISLKDDGIGIDKSNITYGNGLINMKSRACSIGGELIIDSSTEGTTITYQGKISSFKKLLFSFTK